MVYVRRVYHSKLRAEMISHELCLDVVSPEHAEAAEEDTSTCGAVPYEALSLKAVPSDARAVPVNHEENKAAPPKPAMPSIPPAAPSTAVASPNGMNARLKSDRC